MCNGYCPANDSDYKNNRQCPQREFRNAKVVSGNELLEIIMNHSTSVANTVVYISNNPHGVISYYDNGMFGSPSEYGMIWGKYKIDKDIIIRSFDNYKTQRQSIMLKSGSKFLSRNPSEGSSCYEIKITSLKS